MNDPYSRVYWSVMDDPKFDTIRHDPRLFGAWALMLVAADMAWPASAYIPPTVPSKSVVALEKAGLVDLIPGHRYRVHGLAAEREKRSQSGRNAAALRWHSEGNAKPMLGRGRGLDEERVNGASTEVAHARSSRPVDPS